ncbi:prepilin-type N-terminal cleavage/methylation domain-containing protein [Candidatus Woesebacteria bacterium]|nr:prepilin-type N-terminal cleavage/methylation domain-containing protein [Candidatus Woesebacteria bacterium]
MRNESAYTLLEILVVLGILALVFGVGLASFREFSRRQALENVVRQLKGDLRLTQELALSGKKPAAGCPVLDGYRFIVNTGSVSYQINAVCTSPLTVINPPEKSVSLSSRGISGMVVTGANPFLFKVIGEGTDITSGTSVVITLSQANTNNQALVTVTSGGEIR